MLILRVRVDVLVKVSLRAVELAAAGKNVVLGGVGEVLLEGLGVGELCAGEEEGERR